MEKVENDFMEEGMVHKIGQFYNLISNYTDYKACLKAYFIIKNTLRGKINYCNSPWSECVVSVFVCVHECTCASMLVNIECLCIC